MGINNSLGAAAGVGTADCINKIIDVNEEDAESDDCGKAVQAKQKQLHLL